MIISYNWLKNYIDVDLDAEQVAQLLTDCGLEVEGVEKVQSVKGGLEGIVIGEVLSKEKHPNADKLNLAQVNVGNGDPLTIVCGAPNLAIGQKVVVATIGTTLYSGEESFQIKKSKIRGELSEGMLCSEAELGLGQSHEGIMSLAGDAKVGTAAKTFFNIEDDVVFEIGLTPNRADATGHIGVARDLMTVLNLNGNYQLKQPSVDQFKIANTNQPVTVEVMDEERCPRYAGVTISNLQVKESPDWLKKRLLSIGLTPINNIVDVTNFVLHETGQPLHAFDLEKVKGNAIKVQCVKAKTKFTTLDEVERELSDEDLMICDTDKPMCIAGVFGGLDSGVSNATKTIFLESAYFNPVTVRKSAKRHGLNTDASFRFERGADPNNALYALKRAALLLKEVAGGEVSSEIVDVYPKPIANYEVDFSYANCDRLIGKQLDPKLIKDILENLEIEITAETADGLKLSVPPFKVDVEREVDVIEEILRVYGYNNVEVPEKLSASLSNHVKPDKERITNVLSDLLVSNGFNELLSNSLTKSSYYPGKEDSLVTMKNPLSKDLNVLRQTMLFNGLETIVYNQNRKSPDLRLFEWGMTYLKKGAKFKQSEHLALYLTGSQSPENWNSTADNVDFFELKGMVNLMIERLGLNGLKFQSNESDASALDFGLVYTINDMPVVNFGKVKDATSKQFDIDQEVYYAEFNYDNIMKLMKLNKTTYQEVPKFPEMRRDLALLIDNSVHYNSIEQIALKQDNRLLKAINLFDVYEGKNLPDGKKSYGVSFTFLDDQKTLTDKQVDKIMSKIISALQQEVNAELR